MPFLFIVTGVVMLASAVRGTTSDLVTLVKGDFTGKDNFIYWIAAIGIIGALGYVGPLRTPSRYMLALVLIVLFLKNGGVFSEFKAAIDGEASQVGSLSSSSPLSSIQPSSPLTGTPSDLGGSSPTLAF